MAEERVNLWTAPGPADEWIADFLGRLAQDLASATEGVLKGEVAPAVLGPSVNYAFYVVAPSLDDYRYRLFSVWRDVAGGGQIRVDGGYAVEVVTNLEELETAVARIVQSPETRSLLEALKNQSRKMDQMD